MKMKKILLLLSLSPFSLFAQKNTAVGEQVAPGIHKIIINNNVNATVIVSPDKGLMLIDTGFEGTGAVLDSAIKSISKLPIKGIINTHCHGDHVGGNAYFVNNGVKMVASTEFTQSKVEGVGKPNVRLTQAADIRIFDGGHTEKDIVLVYPNEKVVVVADYLFADRFPFVDIENGGNVLRYLDNQSKIIEAFPSDYKVIGGHGRVYTMAEYKKLNEDLQETVAMINSMIMADDALEDIKAAKPLAGWAKFDWDFVNQDKWIELIYNSIR